MPGARRPTSRSQWDDRFVGASGIPDGNQTSTPASSMSNPAGITPVTVVLRPLTSTVPPTTPGSPPNARCHSPWEITTTLASVTSSSRPKVRPMVGLTPSVVKNSAVTAAAVTRTGASEPAILTRLVRHAPIDSNDRARSCSSRYSGGETQNSSNSSVGNWL